VLAAVASVQTGSAVARTLFDAVGAPGVVLLRLGLSSLLLLALLRPRFWRWSRASLQSAVLLGVAMAGMNSVLLPGDPDRAAGRGRHRRVRRAAARGAGADPALARPGLGGPGRPAASPCSAWTAAGRRWPASRWRSWPGCSGAATSWPARGWGHAARHRRARGALLVATVLVLPFGASGAAEAFTDPRLLLVARRRRAAVVGGALRRPSSRRCRRIPTRVFGVLMSLQPAAAAVAGLLVLGQRLGVREVVALVLVSLASAGVTLGRRRERVPVQPVD
jgi:inner membrane transporter RhtA